jgi:hypothetical protein
VARDLAPRFQKQAEVIWRHYNAMLQAFRDVGQLSPDAYKAIRERNQRHVGFYRLFEDYELPAGGGGRGRRMAGGAGLRRQTGSARQIISPLESILKDTYRTGRADREFPSGARARAGVDDKNIEGLGRILDEVPAPRDVVELHAADVVEQLKRARPGQARSDHRPGRAAGARRSPGRSAAGVPRSAGAGGRRAEGPGLSAHDRRRRPAGFR